MRLNHSGLTGASRAAQVMILTLDKEKGRVSLSTKKLEPTPGDMLRDPDLVFRRADEMAAAFRCARCSYSGNFCCKTGLASTV